MTSPQVRARVRDPGRVGSLPDDDPAVGRGEAGSLDAGAVARIYVRADVTCGLVTEVRFQVFGCSAAIASASLVAEWLEGRPVGAVDALTADAVAATLELPPERRPMGALAVEAARRAVAHWRRRVAAVGAVNENRR